MITNKRGPNTKNKVKLEIFRLKKNNPDMTAEQIERKLNKEFKDTDIFVPKKRAITNILKKNPKKIEPSQLDNPWSLAASIKHNLPSEIDKLLIKNRKENYGTPVTIRVARWMARLYPLIKKEKKTEQERIALLTSLVVFYAEREQKSEIMEVETNTGDLDKKFFIDKDWSEDSIFKMHTDLLGEIDVNIPGLEPLKKEAKK